jgi:hypothetical protein
MAHPTKCPACDETAGIEESKRGGLSIYCPHCGYQGFAKTPRAASALRLKITGTTPPTPAADQKPKPAKTASGFLEEL